MHLDQPTGATLRETMLRHQAKGSLPPRRRPSQFLASRSFSAALSSIDSASRFFRRRFSSSSPFSRAASAGPIPAYFDFQRQDSLPLGLTRGRSEERRVGKE